jgi:CHAD domain-containing protein
MANKSVQKYSAKRLKSLNQLLSKPLEQNNVDTLHKIRIEIKKLHAISRFLKYCNIKILHKKTVAKLDLIFSASGKIREIQVGLQLIKTRFPEIKTHECVEILKKRLEKYIADFTKKYKKYEKIDDNLITEHIKINKLNLITYITRLQDSRRLISKGPKELPSMIHKIRVHLKDVSYLSKWLDTENQTEEDMKFISELGNWHDLISLRKLILKTLAKNEFNEVNTNQLILVIQKINRSVVNKLNQLNRVGERKKH